MTDFSSLQIKVNDLKAKVTQNSITPAYLGALLDDFIVQMKAIVMTGMSDDVKTALTNSQTALQNAQSALNKAGSAETSANSALQNALSAIEKATTAIEKRFIMGTRQGLLKSFNVLAVLRFRFGGRLRLSLFNIASWG